VLVLPRLEQEVRGGDHHARIDAPLGERIVPDLGGIELLHVFLRIKLHEFWRILVLGVARRCGGHVDVARFAHDVQPSSLRFEHDVFGQLLFAGDDAAGDRCVDARGAADDDRQGGREELDRVGLLNVRGTAFGNRWRNRATADRSEVVAPRAELIERPADSAYAADRAADEWSKDGLLERIGLLGDKPLARSDHLGDDADQAHRLTGTQRAQRAVESALERAAVE
jgi:hypothetical protein